MMTPNSSKETQWNTYVKKGSIYYPCHMFPFEGIMAE